MQWSDISFTPRTLRQFAALWIVFFLALAAWQAFGRDNRVVGVWLGLTAVTIGPLGLYRPQSIKPIYTVWMAAVFPIGWLVSLVAVAIVYYLVVTPIALFFRLSGRDVLSRHEAPEGETYWRSRPAVAKLQRYLRQY